MKKLKNLFRRVSDKTTELAVRAKTHVKEVVENRDGSHTVEILIGVLIAVIVGIVVLGVFKDKIPGLANKTFSKVDEAFAEGLKP